MIRAITGQHERNRGGLVVGYSCTRSTRGVRLKEERIEGGERNCTLYTALVGSAGWTRDIGDGLENLAIIRFSTRRRRPWVLACTRPKTCDQHDLRHVNGSDRDALEGGRELGWFW